MKKFVLLFIALLALILPLVGCGGETKARLGQEFSLAIGQTATIQGESLAVKFLDVTADSRCPKGATCIWAGEAKSLVSFIVNGQPKEVVLTEPGLSAPPFQQTEEGYQVAFSLTPYPEVGKEIDEKGYRLVLTVTR